MLIYSVYDSKAEAYMQPFFMQTRGAALRAFSDAVDDSNSVLSKHPEDYTLFEIGEFSDSDGTLTPLIPAVTLGKALDFVRPSNITPIS